jgi:hypothetical protein
MSENPISREKRLQDLTGMLELVLGPEWLYVVIIHKPGDDESTNLVSNTPDPIAEQMIREIGERWNKGTRPKQL